MQHDFDFRFGATRHLRGHGYKGLLALTLVLVALIIVALSTKAIATSGLSWIWDLASRSAGL